MLLLIIYLCIAIGFSFYCSIAEAVLLSTTPSFIATLRKSKPAAAERLHRLKSNIDRPLAAILSLNTIAHTIGAAGVGAQAAVALENVPLGVVSGVLTLLILIFSEIIPKTIGALYWRKLAPPMGITIEGLILLMYPLVWLSERITRLLSGGKDAHQVSREELAATLAIGAQQGVLDAHELSIFNSLMRFPKIKVCDVMTPRAVVLRMDQSMTIGEFFEAHPDVPVSRLPIYDETFDHTTGFVLKNDLLLASARGTDDRPLSDFRREIISVPDDMPLPRVLQSLLRDRIHIAMVVNQYGSTVGIVTLEDIVETLLGLEIVDEQDREVDMQQFAREQWKQRAAKAGLDVNSEPPRAE
jgi:CBS domain containing-hemolysin-like protein